MGLRLRHGLAASLSALLSIAANEAAAQTETSGTSQNASEATADIIVTARRQAENLQDVPLSIIAVDDRMLNERNVKTANDLPLVAAGLSVQNTASNRNDTTFSIRGQGRTFGQNSPGVVAYFAEVPDFSTTFYDLENVQVLKGPQGTLFGRNTTGGAILFVPKRPTNDLDGFFNFRIGEYERRDVEFAVGGAIVPDKVMLRFAGQFLNREGFTKNLFNDSRTDAEDRKSFRVSLLLTPSERFENYTLFEYTSIEEAGSGASIGGFTATNPVFSASTPTQPPLLPQLTAALAAQQARGPRIIDVDFPLSNGFKSRGVLNSTTLDMTDDISLKNIFSYRWYQMETNYDIDGTDLPILNVSNPFQGNWITQRTEEIQLRGNFDIVDVVAGYYDERNKSPAGSVGFDTVQYVQLPPIPGLLPAGYLGPIRAFVISGGSLNTSKAFYGEANLRPLDGLTLTAGIRRTKDFRSTSTEGTKILIPDIPFPLPAGAPSANEATFKATTWNLAALYEFTPDLNAYATVRRGYKSGGFNSTALNPADQFFRPETVTDYEIGIKSKWGSGDWAIRANLDFFYDDYKDIQRFVNLNTIPASTVTRNAAAGNIKGVDVDLAVAAGSIFSIDLKYTYLDAEYDEYIDPGLGDLSNSRFPNSPKHQLNVTPRVSIPTSDEIGKISIQSNIYYQSLIAFDPVNRPNGNPVAALSVPGATAPGYTRIDLRADWHDIMDTSLSAAIFVKNITDKTYIVGGNNQLPTQFGTVAYLYGEPRMFGVEFRFDF
ncbi:TonB-dependent receptor [Sphingomonas sp. KC8]|uniref:TonB-dependent receptor n=1 Tax=Sphingomonas sp. KC8 TaxID=1030157 RepID=UPI0009FE2BF5|nr:TonB-dependent receptor [Sphingomonas sp. KC8]ARS26940.1 putative TonB-dependent receptor [Sphingomonas sp. KC8]